MPPALLERAARRPGLLAFGAGAVAAAGQAPLGLWPLALAGFAGLFALVLRAPGPLQGAKRAWLFGGGYFAAALSWIVEPFLVDVARHGWMAPFALLFMSFGLALFWAAAGWAAARAGTGARRAFALAVALGLAELARAHVLTGFPWALIGHLWIGTPVMQMAAFAGAHGLTALALLALALPFAWGARGAALALALVGAGWGGGVWRLARPEPQVADPVHVRLIQPNAAQRLKWRPDMVPVFFERQLDYTAAPSETAPDLIVWPETAVPYLLERAGGALERIADAAAGTPVVFGVQRRDSGGVYNSLAVLGGQGALTHVYDKHHLVPFGEYIPLRAVAARLGLSGLAAEFLYGYTPGPGPQVLDLGAAGRALPLICYEAIFPQDLRAATRPGWILQITNDAWFGAVSGPYQHLAQARLRAVEQGLPVLRSANTGVTAVIDARGRVLDSLPLNTAGQLTAPLPRALTATPYARTGDWPWLALYLLVAAIALVPALRKRR
ncbi:apolipoprotein N-acyltransferase [Actibacterium sp. MT2.3-13A]|uniref:apolipoprotein N-acyltransferase n=1 Tax=Actibacterium sp. MT2.3-13A TaxID=2828332 RepID=UPI001BA7D4F8|nr:apolipoprotein N-acyltransferase [Actibacterium sp. MT2.3-13A]